MVVLVTLMQVCKLISEPRVAATGDAGTATLLPNLEQPSILLGG